MAYCSGSLGSFPCQIWIFNFTLLPDWGRSAKGSSKVPPGQCGHPASQRKDWLPAVLWPRPPWPLRAMPALSPAAQIYTGKQSRGFYSTSLVQEIAVVRRQRAAVSQAPPQGDAVTQDLISHQTRAAVGQWSFPSTSDGSWSPWQGCRQVCPAELILNDF